MFRNSGSESVFMHIADISTNDGLRVAVDGHKVMPY